MNLDFKDIYGHQIEVGDLILRDGTFFEIVEFIKGAYVSNIISVGDYRPYLGDWEHLGLFYDNWSDYKKQGLEIIAKDIL